MPDQGKRNKLGRDGGDMGRMIYTRLALDMASGEVLEREGFLYRGSMVMLGGSGGGSSTTNTVDYEYNARMAALSEEQQAWAKEYFGVWQQYQKPYEIAQTQANMAMLPKETELYGKQLDAANSILPLETEITKAQLEAQNRVMPQETALYEKSLTAASELLPKQTEAANKFLNLALNGVDVNERMGLAAADAGNAWKDARETAARASARLGVNPNSGRFQGIMGAMNTAQAAQMAGARTQARVGAEQENFQRLAQAMGMNAAGTYLQKAQALKSGNKNVSNEILQGINLVKE